MLHNVHSYFSLRYGTLSVEELILQAKKFGHQTLAITDINNSMGVMDFVKHAFANGIMPIAGMDFRNGDNHLYTCIARNNEGFREINEWRTLHNLQKSDLPLEAPPFDYVYVIYPFGSRQYNQLNDNEFIGVRPRDLRKLYAAGYRHDKLLMYNPVTFHTKKTCQLHKHLRAIDNNILLNQLESKHLADENELFCTKDQLLYLYRDFPQIMQNSERMAGDCCFSFDFKSSKNKKTFTGSLYDDRILLEKLALEGFKYRYPKGNPLAEQRIKKELDIVFKLGFSAYFLITWDIVRYSMSRGFYHVGRGSGANSLVAYCLKITDVDPIELNLYFERFLNPKRTSPPDFDIDYSWKDRDDVQDYIFKRHGKDFTALLGATSTFKGSSIYRELGKVYGLPKEEIDHMVEYPAKAINESQLNRNIFEIGKMMADFPNIRSIHAGGVLISEKPLAYYTALDLPPKGFPTTQWDMYVAEDIGFDKLDILSQRGIGHINECVAILEKNRNIKIDPHQVEKFKTDEKVKSLLKKGEAIGCFYVESPAMRGLLKKLRCDNYLSLVAASSIIRPGVAKSGMMREYIHRFHHPEGFTYLHPVMKEQLEETFGIMVYQEDVLKVCHHFAGLDLADADVLRRIMSGKPRFRDEFELIVNRFFTNCQSRGYPEEITKEVWRQIHSFAGYSFSKAHSASYAVESFQSLYLKAHYPLEFMVAVINNFGGFYRTWVYFEEARRWGAKIELPCVNNSMYLTSIKENKIFTGFIHLANLEENLAKKIVGEREKNGFYKSLDDFISRVGPGPEQLSLLIRIDAFRFTGISKVQMLWQAKMLTSKVKTSVKPGLLFEIPRKNFELPDLNQSKLEDAYDEIELIDFPVSMTMFDMLQTRFRGEVMASEMMGFVGKKVRMLGNLVTMKYVWTVKKDIMHFGTFLDAKGEFFDSVNFPDSLKKYPFKGRGIYLILGIITEEFGYPSITVEKMAKLPFMPDPRYK
ncbi:MAG: DNA polymerase III subunit alpha [Bacteroidales bacterium]